MCCFPVDMPFYIYRENLFHQPAIFSYLFLLEQKGVENPGHDQYAVIMFYMFQEIMKVDFWERHLIISLKNNAGS